MIPLSIQRRIVIIEGLMCILFYAHEDEQRVIKWWEKRKKNNTHTHTYWRVGDDSFVYPLGILLLMLALFIDAGNERLRSCEWKRVRGGKGGEWGGVGG